MRRDRRPPVQTDSSASGTDRAKPRNAGHPARSPDATGLPLDSSTGAEDFGASIAGLEPREIVGTVEIIGDGAKAFGFALGAVDAVRHVQPFERCILGRRDFGLNIELEAFGRRSDGQQFRRHGIGGWFQPMSIDRQRNQLQSFPVQHQGLHVRCSDAAPAFLPLPASQPVPTGTPG